MNDKTLQLEYPQMISADKLLFIYQNINEAESYQYMLTPYIADQTGLGVADSARIDSWELVLDSYEVIDSFKDSVFVYTAKDGSKFLRCRFTVTNHSNKSMNLFPIIYYEGKDLTATIYDEDGNAYRPSRTTSSGYFEGNGFEPGESITRYMLFEIPDSLTNNNQPIEIEFSITPQKAVFMLN